MQQHIQEWKSSLLLKRVQDIYIHCNVCVHNACTSTWVPYVYILHVLTTWVPFVSSGIKMGPYSKHSCQKNSVAGHHQDGHLELIPKRVQALQRNKGTTGPSWRHTNTAGQGIYSPPYTYEAILEKIKVLDVNGNGKRICWKHLRSIRTHSNKTLFILWYYGWLHSFPPPVCSHKKSVSGQAVSLMKH